MTSNNKKRLVIFYKLDNVIIVGAFVFTHHGASRAFLTVGQIMIFPNYVIVTSKPLCSLHIELENECGLCI